MEIMKGGEPYSYKGNSDIGVLVLHGFTGTTSSIIYLAEAFAKEGYHVELPRLTGHGTSWQDLEKAKVKNWFKDVDSAYQELKKRAKYIFVAGLSVGGTLALYMGEKYADLRGIIVINNALIFTDIQLKFICLLKYFVRTGKGIGSDIKDPTKKEICYDTVPTKAAHEMMKLLSHVKRNLSKVTAPIIFFRSKEDHVIPEISAHYAYEHISSTRTGFYWLNNSYHVATMDNDKDIICEKSLEFIKSQIKTK